VGNLCMPKPWKCTLGGKCLFECGSRVLAEKLVCDGTIDCEGGQDEDCQRQGRFFFTLSSIFLAVKYALKYALKPAVKAGITAVKQAAGSTAVKTFGKDVVENVISGVVVNNIN